MSSSPTASPSAPTLRDLLEPAEISPATVDAFLAGNEFPLVERGSVTFVYKGAARSVRLRHWVFGLPTAQPLSQIAGTDLWYLRMELPDRSRVEYKFEVESDSVTGWILDPLNEHRALDPFGANSVCHAYGYERPGWSLPQPEPLRGSLEELRVPSAAFGEDRTVRLYVPARFRRSRSYPLLIAHDGDDFLRFANLNVVLDNLIHRLEIPPLIVALTTSPDRLHEYAGDPRHAQFLAEDLLPLLNDHLPLIDRPSERGLMGASFGAVASLHTAWRYPGMFGDLLLQSGSFAFTDIGRHERGPAFDPVVRFMNAFRQNPGQPARRLFISCGTYESLIHENRALMALLQQDRQLRLRYREVPDGHNWENWRDRLQDGLSWLFPGPLWMVYE